MIQAFAAAHGLPEVTVVADAGMLSEANPALDDLQRTKVLLGIIEDLRNAVAHKYFDCEEIPSLA